MDIVQGIFLLVNIRIPPFSEWLITYEGGRFIESSVFCVHKSLNKEITMIGPLDQYDRNLHTSRSHAINCTFEE